MLFVRSMTLVMGHAYKRLRGSPEYDTRKYFSPLSYSSFSFNNSAMVLSCFKLASPTPCRTWWEGWAGSPNRCRCEACTRDNNNFLGSASAWVLEAVCLWFMLPRGRSGGSSTLTVYFIYFALIIQAPTKPKSEPMIHLVAMGLIHLVFDSWNLPQTKIWI
jgi:hypothetical protein